MFGVVDEERSHPVESADEALWRELGEISDLEARNKQRVTELVRLADERGTWKRAGCSSLAQWFAQAFRCDYRAALRVTETAAALRALPALDEAMSSGSLTLDQVAAATPFATPESDAELARIAVGKAPGAIARVARTLTPPKVADDDELYKRRALSMTWISGGRELALSGRLPLEQGLALEQAIWNIAKPHRAEDKKAGRATLEWQQYTADALVTLTRHTGGSADDGVRRSPTTLIVHLSDDAPPMLEGAGPISVETAERLACDARRLTIKPSGRDLLHSRIGRCASYPRYARSTSAQASTANTRAAPPPTNSKATTSPMRPTAARPSSRT
jgi:hypothetical protein